MTVSPPPGRPQPPQTFDQLIARHVEVAVELSGADKSSWNGTFRPLDEGDVRGRAEWDGTLRYSERKIAAPLKRMFARPGDQRVPQTLAEYRSALKTMLHENGHLLVAKGTNHWDSQTQFKASRAMMALEEGITELWAQRNLGKYIDRLGLEQIAPGIGAVQEDQSYAPYTPAAATLVEGIAAASGLHPDEVLRRMNNVHAVQKWEVAAELMYEANGLDKSVPADRRPEAIHNIARAMQNSFERDYLDLQGYDATPGEYADVGRNAVAAAQREADGYRTTYGGEPEADRGPGQQQGPHRGGGTPGSDGRLEDANQAMALHTSTAPPLAHAGQIATSQFGSRREPVDQPSRPGRQSPERGG